MNNSRTQGRYAIQIFEGISTCGSVARLSSLSLLFLATTLLVGFSQGSTPKIETNPAAVIDLAQPLTVSWRYESNLTLNLTPAFNGERIYVPLAGGTLVSLNAHNGQLNWRSEMGGELSASPAADQRAVYVASETSKPESGVRRATGSLRALGWEGGVTQWMRTLAMPLRGGLTLSSGKLFAASSDGKIYAFESTNGEARWAYDYGAPFNSKPVVDNSRVYIGSEDGNLLALDEPTGKLLWHYRSKGAVRGPVATGEDIVYFGSDDGYVYAVNATNGRLIWRKRTGAGVQAVVRAGNELLAASLDNFVYRFSLTGTRSWKRRLPGRIAAQPFLTDSAALFMPFSSSSAIVLELRDGRQVNLLPVGEEITTSASPIAVGDVVLLTTEHGLLAFAQPREKPKPK